MTFWILGPAIVFSGYVGMRRVPTYPTLEKTKIRVEQFFQERATEIFLRTRDENFFKERVMKIF